MRKSISTADRTQFYCSGHRKLLIKQVKVFDSTKLLIRLFRSIRKPQSSSKSRKPNNLQMGQVLTPKGDNRRRPRIGSPQQCAMVYFPRYPAR